MHRIYPIVIVTLLSSPLVAQQETLRQPLSGPDPSSVTVGGAGTIHRLRLTEVIQNTVYMPQEGAPVAQIAQGVVTGPEDWAEIGQVQEIVASPEGTIVELVVDVGGFLGGAVANIGISINEISFVSVVNNPEETFLIIYTGNRERLEAAPEWTWEGSQPSAGMMGISDLEGPFVADEESGVLGDQRTLDRPATQSGPDGVPLGGTDVTEVSPGVLDAVGVAALSGDALLGMEVRGVNDDSIGVISDLLLDADGNVAAVVIDVGGFLGLGAHVVALPMDQIEFVRWGDGQSILARVPYGEAELQALPEHPE